MAKNVHRSSRTRRNQEKDEHKKPTSKENTGDVGLPYGTQETRDLPPPKQTYAPFTA